MPDSHHCSLSLVPLHKYPSFLNEVLLILNSEWPRSEALRSRSLNSSCDELPTSLILFEQNDDNQVNEVIGHARINKLPNEGNSVWIESVVIRKSKRGQGYGKVLMEKTEKYAADLGFINAVLSTHGQDKFYKKLHYDFCSPVSLYGGVVHKFLPKNSFLYANKTNDNYTSKSGEFIDMGNDIESSKSLANDSPLSLFTEISATTSSCPYIPPPPPLPSYIVPKLRSNGNAVKRLDGTQTKLYMRKVIKLKDTGSSL